MRKYTKPCEIFLKYSVKLMYVVGCKNAPPSPVAIHSVLVPKLGTQIIQSKNTGNDFEIWLYKVLPTT